MRGRKLKLGLPEVAAVIDERHAKERDARNKNRLLAIKLAARGEHTSAEIADFCGIARGHLFRWMKTVREEGLEGLLKRGKPGPKEGTCRGMSPSVTAELAAKLAAGDFVSAVAAMRWLKESHGLECPYQSVWRWLKKAGGKNWCLCPNPPPRQSRNWTSRGKLLSEIFPPGDGGGLIGQPNGFRFVAFEIAVAGNLIGFGVAQPPGLEIDLVKLRRGGSHRW